MCDKRAKGKWANGQWGKRAKGHKGKRAKGQKGKRAKTTNYNFPKTLTLVREQLATLPVYFFLAYLAASLLNALDVGSSAGQYYLELTINFDDICDNY